MLEIAPGVYMEQGYEGGNVGLVLSERGALLIDTPMLPPDARNWKWTLHQLGVADNYYGIVNTDYHPEHVLGDMFFMPTRIFGHELAMKQIAKYKTSLLDQLSNAYREQDADLADQIAQLDVYPPEVCVDDRTTLHLGDREVEVLYLNGHTPASVGVYLRKEKVLFAGDNVICGEHPVMSQANSAAWIEALHRLSEMDIDTIVPGEGGLCTKDALGPLVSYISEMRERVIALFRSGASRRECVDKVGMLDYFPFADEQATRIKRRRRENVERVYSEVRMALSKR